MYCPHLTCALCLEGTNIRFCLWGRVRGENYECDHLAGNIQMRIIMPKWLQIGYHTLSLKYSQ